MKTSIRNKLEHLSRRLGELDLLLSSETATQDMDAYRRLTREHAEIAPVAALFAAWRKAEAGVPPGTRVAMPDDGVDEIGGTTHIAIVDREGNARR